MASTKLTPRVREFLRLVDVADWHCGAAGVYGTLRAACETGAVCLSPLDVMIAAHAVSLDATLVTRDRAFFDAPVGLVVEHWEPRRPFP